MDCIATGAARDIDYFFDAKITLARGRGADGIGFVGQADVERFAVDFAENRHAANAQLAAGAQDAHGDFAAIGNQDFPEHGPLVLLLDFSMRDIAAKMLAGRWCLIVWSWREREEAPREATGASRRG